MNVKEQRYRINVLSLILGVNWCTKLCPVSLWPFLSLGRIIQTQNIWQEHPSSFENETMITLATGQCHYDYMYIIWYSGITKRTKDKLQKAQNKLTRLVLNLSLRAHISPNHLNWLPVEGRVQHLKLIMFCETLQGLCPNSFIGYFQFFRTLMA